MTGGSAPERRADGTLALTGRMPAGYSFQDGYLKYLAFDGADGTFDWRTFGLDRDGSRLQPFMNNWRIQKVTLHPERIGRSTASNR